MVKKIGISMVLAIAALAPAQEPTPEPTPVRIHGTLSRPVLVERAATVSEEITTWSVEWLLIEPESRRIIAKVQPFNTEVTIDGDEFTAAMDRLLANIQNTIVRVIEPRVEQKARARADTVLLPPRKPLNPTPNP